MKVLFQSRQTLFSAPGGDTVQLLKTKEYLEKLGEQVDVSTEMEPDVSEYDIVHLFNLMRPQDIYLPARNAKKQGKTIVLSTIYGLYTESERYNRKGITGLLVRMLNMQQIDYLKVIARAVLNGEFNKGVVAYLLKGHKRLQKKIINMVDVFLPNSHSEMKRVASDFRMQDYKYVFVPNAVDIHKFDYNVTVIEPEYEQYRDCILCVSRIEGRKNQLNVIKAVKNLPYKMVFLGKAGTNSSSYYEECKNEAGDNVVFLGQIDHDKLPQFYKLCKVHVLASWMETPGLSSLEAAVMKANIVVTKKGDPEDYFGDHAYYCEPDNVESIQEAIIKAYDAPIDNELVDKVKSSYSWENTARATLEGYNMA